LPPGQDSFSAEHKVKKALQFGHVKIFLKLFFISRVEGLSVGHDGGFGHAGF
jgi:hypothetical protein